MDKDQSNVIAIQLCSHYQSMKLSLQTIHVRNYEKAIKSYKDGIINKHNCFMAITDIASDDIQTVKTLSDQNRDLVAIASEIFFKNFSFNEDKYINLKNLSAYYKLEIDDWLIKYWDKPLKIIKSNSPDMSKFLSNYNNPWEIAII